MTLLEFCHASIPRYALSFNLSLRHYLFIGIGVLSLAVNSIFASAVLNTLESVVLCRDRSRFWHVLSSAAGSDLTKEAGVAVTVSCSCALSLRCLQIEPID